MTRPAYFFSEDLQLYASRADLVHRQPMKCLYTTFAGRVQFVNKRTYLSALLRETLGFVPEPGEIPASLAAQIANAPQTSIEMAEQQRLKATNKVWVTDPDKKDQWVATPAATKPISEKAPAGEQPSFSRYGHPSA